MRECPHNVIRKKRSGDPDTFNAYVCGSCAKIFEVEEHIPPPPLPYKPEPMGSESKVPWGLRGRQA